MSIIIYCVCGLPGGGKSFYMVREIMKAIYEGGYNYVFTNIPVAGAFVLEKEMLKFTKFPVGSLIVIDEANSWFPSRKALKLDQEYIDFFHGHRHMGCDVMLVTQHPMRIDVVVRDLTNKWIWSKSMRIRTKNREKFKDGKRALWFKYDYFQLEEDIFRKRKKGEPKIRLKRERLRAGLKIAGIKVFDFYNSYVELFNEGKKEPKFEYWAEPIEKKEKESIMNKLRKKSLKQSSKTLKQGGPASVD